MEMSFYDACLFITNNDEKNFAIVGLQTGNTFNIRSKRFMNKKETEIIETKFKAKP